MRPRLAPHFTCVTAGTVVWLVAGEDVRYRLDAGGDPRWLVDAIARCDGTRTLAEIVEAVPAAQRADAETTVQRLYEERVLVDGTAREAHVATADVDVFRQATLDHAALLAYNARALAAGRRWLWLSTGAGSRAYVGPLFVPGAGPCAACLLVHFKRLSPAPDLYDALIAHGEAGQPFATALLPAPALEIAESLVHWKCALAAEPVASPALYALHVVEVETLTVSSHAPIRDPECAACGA